MKRVTKGNGKERRRRRLAAKAVQAQAILACNGHDVRLIKRSKDLFAIECRVCKFSRSVNATLALSECLVRCE